jgi:hypothetical protein
MSESADAPLDELDAAILDELAATYSLVDPPPPDLHDRVTFAIAVRDLDAEMARLTEDVLVGSGARGGERPRTVTFDSTSLTVMVTVVVLPGGRRRVDGWLAPPGPLRVEMRTAGSRDPTHSVTADDTGRFVVEAVPPGLAQLIVRLAAPDRTVVTPPLVL